VQLRSGSRRCCNTTRGDGKTECIQTSTFLSLGRIFGIESQREDIILHPNKWNSSVRSLIIPGYSEDPDGYKMKQIDELEMTTNEPPTDNLYNTTVTQYFRNHVLAGNGAKLFAYVYPPMNGTYEFLVKVQNDPEAKDYLKKAIGELVRRMTDNSVEKIFHNPVEARKHEYLPPWRPYTRGLMLLPQSMPTGESVDTKNTKRSRNKESYIAAKSNTTEVNKTIPVKPGNYIGAMTGQCKFSSTNSTNDSVTTITKSTSSSEYEMLNNKIIDLQKQIETRIENNNKVHMIETEKMIDAKTKFYKKT
jgi:hypothetical protein